jgi:hypothetical protein
MPGIDYRPPWCPNPKSTSIISYAGVFCLGRLRAPVRHDDLMDTHCWCICDQNEGEKQGDPDYGYINLEDMILVDRCMKAGIEDVLTNKLYKPPGFGTEYGQAEAREATGIKT